MLTQHTGSLRLLLPASSLSLPGRARRSKRPSQGAQAQTRNSPGEESYQTPGAPRTQTCTAQEHATLSKEHRGSLCLHETPHWASCGTGELLHSRLSKSFVLPRKGSTPRFKAKVLHPTFPKEQKDTLILKHEEVWGHAGPPSQIWADASAALTSPGRAEQTPDVGLFCEKVPIGPCTSRAQTHLLPPLSSERRYAHKKTKIKGGQKQRRANSFAATEDRTSELVRAIPTPVFTVNHAQARVLSPHISSPQALVQSATTLPN